MLADQSRLINPYPREHFVLLYSNDNKCDNLVSMYINEGLKRKQLCVYASIRMNERVSPKISSQIIHYEENIKNENLLNISLKPFYISALNNDMKPFEDIKKELVNKVTDRKDTRIRFVCDLTGFLFNTTHFDECIDLEQWWQNKPFPGSYVCLYPNLMLSKYPFHFQKNIVFRIHDNVILC